MVKKNNSDSVEPKIDSTPRSKAPASKKPAEKSASAKTPAGKKPAAKTTKAEVVESAPAAKKPTEKKPAAKKPIEKKPVAKAASSKGAGSKTEGKSAATAAPVTVTATSMLFMAPDLPTPVIDKKRGRPIEDKKTADQGETHVRRRSRRREGELAEGEQLPPNTVVKVRTPREPKEPSNEPTRIKGSTRLEAKKQRRRDGRDAGRRRSSTITESEFLARRESVERTMIVRSKDGKIQLGVLEDKILVEHYVAKASEASLIGNVYLGKVQNVLPSMEAAFVDIGRGRNAVLYSGEVDWELAETGNQPRRIELALKSGDTVLVQVTKDPVGQKGARLTSQVSLPGRYLVYVPNGSMNGISRKLPESERTRLKKILKEVLPEDAGVIVRTAAEGATEEQLTLDVQRLQDQWVDIEKKVEKGNAPVLLHSEPDLLVKIVRDVFNEDFQKMVISGDDSHQVISEYLQGVAPDLLERIEIYKGDKDIFDEYRIGEQIAKALERKVYLPSGGSLVIDRTEAMTVVDVNTGKFVGSGGNLEETVTKNNLEAAEELVRQLRLRDIGGIVVVDFIDMVLESNRDLVLRRLMECLSRDRTKHQVAEVTSLGLVQMTRKKLGIGLLEAFSEPCEACASRGVIVHHEPIMRSKHVGEDPRPPKQSGKSKNRDKKQEVPKVVTGERAAEVGNALTKIAASTLAAHEAAGESSPIVAPVSQVDSTDSAESNELLDSVLDALPQPKAPGQGRRRPRSRRGTSSK